MGSLAPLPTDVLVLIFAHAPLSARLRAISRVCKRWRTAVLLSVAAFACPSIHSRAIDLFPRLIDLTFRTSTSPAALPPNIRRLAIDFNSFESLVPLRADAPIPPLTHAEFVGAFSSKVMNKVAIPIMTACRASLVSLSFRMYPPDIELSNFLAATCFPSLTSLRIYTSRLESATYSAPEATALVQFVAAHAPRLHELLITGVSGLHSATELRFPLLRSLTVTVHWVAVSALAQLISNSPSLTELNCRHCTARLDEIAPSALLSLTSLEWTVPEPKPVNELWVAGLTHLRRLSLISSGAVRSLVDTPLLRSAATHFTCHETLSEQEAYTLWSQLSNLTHLRLEQPAQPNCTPALPRLTDFALRCPMAPLCDILRTARLFLTHCPALRTLSVSLPDVAHSEEEMQLIVSLYTSSECVRVPQVTLEGSEADGQRLPRLKEEACGWVQRDFLLASGDR